MHIIAHKINNECHIQLKNYECGIDIPVNHMFKTLLRIIPHIFAIFSVPKTERK